MRTVQRYTWLAAMIMIFGALARADDRAELKQTVKWSIFHEGCRVYAANDQIGNITDIRNCIYDTQRHNQRALDLNAQDKSTLCSPKCLVKYSECVHLNPDPGV